MSVINFPLQNHSFIWGYPTLKLICKIVTVGFVKVTYLNSWHILTIEKINWTFGPKNINITLRTLGLCVVSTGKIYQKIKSGIHDGPKVAVSFKIDLKIGYAQMKLLFQEKNWQQTSKFIPNFLIIHACNCVFYSNIYNFPVGIQIWNSQWPDMTHIRGSSVRWCSWCHKLFYEQTRTVHEQLSNVLEWSSWTFFFKCTWTISRAVHELFMKKK